MTKLLLILYLFSFLAFGKIPLGKDPKTITQEFYNTWSKETIYFLIPDRFVDGDKDNNFNVDRSNLKFYHGGDFQGINQNYSYFKDLNVGTLLFTPILDNRNRDFFGHWGFHGYWPINHKKLDEHLGAEKDLDLFTANRLEANQKFILDIVLNHVGWDHPWKKDHKDWFHNKGDITDYNDYQQLVSHDLTGLSDLNQDHPEVYKRLFEYTTYWIDRTKADGIRMDAVKHIDHPFWRKYIGDVKDYVLKKYGKKDFMFLGEYLHGDANFYKPYLKDGFNGFYDFPVHYVVRDVFAKNMSMMYLPSKLQFTDKIFPSKMILLTFLDNHDIPRFLSLSDEVSVEDMHQALAFNMSIRGIPLVYYGTESHMLGSNGDKGRHSLDINKKPSYDYIAKLNRIRKSSPSLYKGIREDLMASNNHYVFRKITAREESLIIVTRGDESQKITINIPSGSQFRNAKSVTDQITGRKFKIFKNRLQITPKERDILILTVKGDNRYFAKLKGRKLTATKRTMVVRFKTGSLAPAQGEKLYAIGSNDIFGGWDAKKAFGPFKRLDNLRYSAKIPVKDQTQLEFKFIKVKSDGSIVWERSPNRLLFVTKDNKIIEKTWNKL